MASLENDRLFATRWICAGLVSDAPSPGDVVPIECGGRSLMMMRDDAGTLRVFHNLCRHRGMRLAAETCRGLRRIVCRYHSWVYDTAGRLVNAPHFDGPGRHRTDTVDGLIPVRSACWAGLVFVNLSGDAPTFESFIAPLAARWKRYDLDSLRNGASRRFELSANWKLAVENFIDFYHLPSVHTGLNRYSAMSDHYFVSDGEDLFGQGNARYAADDEVVGVFRSFSGLTGEESRITEALCLFPNLLLTIFNDNMRVILVEPRGAGHCSERVELFVNAEQADDPALKGARDALLARFEAFNDEDITIVETLQASMRGGAFDGGVFSPYYDCNVARFHRRVIDAITHQ